MADTPTAYKIEGINRAVLEESQVPVGTLTMAFTFFLGPRDAVRNSQVCWLSIRGHL